jgi:pimeloyl-ACP methyl ester carboxylesterase
MRDDAITLRDGRTIAFTDLGASERSAPVVVYLHGAPTSRLDFVGADATFAERGVRVLCPDRPGYGGSSPQPGRSMVDHASDIAALADRLGVDRFIAVGLSSGGPYALACAAHLGARVRAASVVAGVTDFGWPGAWDDYLPHESELMRQPSPEAAVARCEEQFGPDGMGFLAGDPPAGEASAAETAARPFLDSIVESFRQGVIGYAHDVWVQGRPWPFDPAGIDVPVRVFHGDADSTVPIAHAHRTVAVVPTAVLEIWPGATHLSAAVRVPEVIAALVG